MEPRYVDDIRDKLVVILERAEDEHAKRNAKILLDDFENMIPFITALNDLDRTGSPSNIRNDGWPRSNQVELLRGGEKFCRSLEQRYEFNERQRPVNVRGYYVGDPGKKAVEKLFRMLPWLSDPCTEKVIDNRDLVNKCMLLIDDSFFGARLLRLLKGFGVDLERISMLKENIDIIAGFIGSYVQEMESFVLNNGVNLEPDGIAEKKYYVIESLSECDQNKFNVLMKNSEAFISVIKAAGFATYEGRLASDRVMELIKNIPAPALEALLTSKLSDFLSLGTQQEMREVLEWMSKTPDQLAAASKAVNFAHSVVSNENGKSWVEGLRDQYPMGRHQ